MEEQMTAARVANAICQDTSFSGAYLLVEGKRDVKLYGKFVDKPSVRIKATWGKYKLREVYKLLRERGYSRTLGIRDADFLRVRGNSKFSETYDDAIFATDHHDAEMMIAFCGAVGDYLNVISDPESVDRFEANVGRSVFDIAVSLCYEIGCLRLANKRYSLGLSFKPERPEGNRLKVYKFVNGTDWSTSRAALVNTVWEYSQNRGFAVATRDRMLEALEIVCLEDHPHNEVANGHDFSAMLHLLSTVGLKSKSKLLQDAGCVEDLLIAVFDLKRFSSTALYSKVSAWSAKNMKKGVFASP